MAGINTSVEFLEYPHNPMGELGHVSPWERARPIQPSSHLALNSFVGNGSFPQFSPASQVPQSLLGPETPFESSFFQCANRENSQRQAVQTHMSIFQRANKNIDTSSEQVLLQSSQSPLGTSKVLSSHENSQSISPIEKPLENDICNENKTSNVVAPTSSHPTAKRVPVFKTVRGKTSNMPLVPENKGKKRLKPFSEEVPAKKHAGLPSFTHSQISAFKPVSRNSIPESASAKKENCENNTSGNQLKTQPLKPKFGKSQHCPNKKMKKERSPDVTDPGSGEGNREDSDAALSNKAGKRNEPRHGSQTEPSSYSSSLSLKDELNTDEENLDVTGTSGIENESELEDLLALTPIQCTSADKKTKMQSKKNLPSTFSSKINKLHGTKGNKKIHTKVNQEKNMSQSQGGKTSKKMQLQVIKGKKKKLSQATQDGKNSHCQATQSCKKKSNSQATSNIKKKKPLKECDNKHNNLLDVQLKKKKNFTKSSSSSASEQQSTKHGLPLQKGNATCCSHTDESNHKISVNEDNSENILQSAPSHDSCESSSDLSSLRPSPEPSPIPSVPQKNSLDKEITLGSSRYKKETSRNADEEITHLSETVKENVVQLLNSMDEDLWVQCDRCSKWRKLTHILDPATLPDKWYCTMLPIPGRNTCQEPEEEWQHLDANYIYYEHQFVVGSVVWAQVPGSPWWPAMVDIDPDYRRYDWFNSTGTHPISYHVTFFGDPVTRAWVTCKNIRVFKQHDTYKKFINDGKKDPTRDILLCKTVQEASHALSMEVRRRRRTYAFVVRYSGKIGKSPVNSHSETPGVKTSTPLKMTFARRKQWKESKRLHPTVSMMAMQPSSAELGDTAAVKDYINNTPSQLSQDIEKPRNTDGNEYESKIIKDQDSDEKLNEQSINLNNPKNEQKHLERNARNKKDLRIDPDFPGVINSNSKEIISKMKHCNLDVHDMNQRNDSDESHETDTNSIQKDDRHFISKTADKNGVENSKAPEQTFENTENISDKNSATFQKHCSSSEVKGTDSQGNEEICDREKEVEKCSHEFDSKNSYMSQTKCDDSHETNEQYDSFNSDCVRNKGQDDDNTHESKINNVSKMSYEDKDDSQNYEDDKGEHNQGQHIRKDYAVQENERYTPHEDAESGYQDPYNTECMEEKQGDKREDDIVNEKHDTERNCKEHYTENNYYQEQDETEASDMQSDTEGSHEQYDTESSHEHDHSEDDNETCAYEDNKGIKSFEEHNYGDYAQDDNEDEYKELVNMESDYEGQDNEENCEAQSSYDDNEGDYEQDNEGTYEGQDSEDNCEGSYEGQNSEDNCEAPYEGQDSEDNCEAPYEGQDSEDNCEGSYEGQDSEDNCEAPYEGQDSEDNCEVPYEGQDCEDNCEVQVNQDYEDNGDSKHQSEDDYEEKDNSECQDNEEQKNYYEEQDNCDYEDESSEDDNEENYEEHKNSDYEGHDDDYEEQDSGSYEEQNNKSDKQDDSDFEKQNNEDQI